MNMGFCTKCGNKVPLLHIQRDGKEYLEKQCPDCGNSYEMICQDATEYKRRKDLMSDVKFGSCNMECLKCMSHKAPDIVFVETTNRCNMNCPICITNVPAMGFEFEPGMEFFDRIFSYYSKFEFPPSMQLFGGEPTVREDLFDIIALARSYGLSVRLVTNGLKLADPEYCRKVVESGASILISFDGLKREMYEKLRGSANSLDLKLKALKNISTHRKGKVILMTVIDKNMNGEDMPQFLDYCLKNSDIVRGVFPMPLSQVWDEERLDYVPERTTQYDVEKMVKNAVEGKAEFVPIGSLDFRNLARLFSLNKLPFVGVHPGCESFTLLISDGRKYVGIGNYLKNGVFSLIRDIRRLDTDVKKYISSGKSGRLKRFSVLVSFGGIIVRHINFGAVVEAKGLKAFLKWLGILGAICSGKKIKNVIKSRTNIKGILQIIVLPFEDDSTQESERLHSCSSGYAFVDPETDKIRSIPLCIWEKYKCDALRSNAEMFNKKGYGKGLKGDIFKNEKVD